MDDAFHSLESRLCENRALISILSLMEPLSSSSENSPDWMSLPPEITTAILQKLSAVDILKNVQFVCTSWHTLCKHPSMWRSIDLLSSAALHNSINIQEFSCHAVRRSCGQLSDISIGCYPKYWFMYYLASRSDSKIRRLRVVSCPSFFNSLFEQTPSKFPFPWLEELEIQSTPLSIASVEAIGNCCPQLKTFKCNGFNYTHVHQYLEELPKVIAKIMPHLCHLELLRTKITNAGLKAILDGCPCLEILVLGISYLCNLKVDDLDEVCSARYKRIVRHRVELPDTHSYEREHIWYGDGPFSDDGFGDDEEEEDDEDDYDDVVEDDEDDDDNNDGVDDDSEYDDDLVEDNDYDCDEEEDEEDGEEDEE